jgi:creatinine amidohydrolase/Fe(II)-dependent formamide hydrolase-like protein
MKIAEMNWMQVEEYLKHDDRAVVPLGSTEQHAYLSLSTDSLLAERVAVEAAEPIGVAVCPVLAYGITPCLLAVDQTLKTICHCEGARLAANRPPISSSSAAIRAINKPMMMIP